MKRQSSEGYKLLIRLPDGMREIIQGAAAANRRTMTGEIVARLEQSFAEASPKPTSRSPSSSVMSQRLEEVERALQQLSAPDSATAGRLNDVEARLVSLEATVRQ
jgi:hypothetical protein